MASLSQLQNAAILIVDDRPANIALLKAMLASAGYQRVMATAEPRAVCALHTVHRFDLILLDLNMPFMNGFEVLAGLKEVEGAEYLPVLALTAAPEHKLRALDAGVMDFMCKPFDHDELLSRIRNLLDSRLLYVEQRDAGARLARYDALTGLANRTLFQHTLERVLADGGAGGGAVLMLKLDGFERINDTFSHAVGDFVLRQFALRLQQCAPAGSVASRFGDDEFALALSAVAAPDDALLVAERVRHCCALPFQLPGGEATLTVSIGIALHPADAADAATLVQYASTALHQARQCGGGCRFFTDAMDRQAQRRFAFESALRRAVEQQEFEVYYQPKVDVQSGRMSGAEALLRWNRPGYGAVAPSSFIPVLEETGLIVEVGAWVLDTACGQIAQWARSAHGPVPVAVNVASRQFADNALQQVVADALARHCVAPGLLALEVTESALMADTERTAATLAALRAMGVKVAIDDFGTGYSSLAYLKRFPVDVLKIDIAFIRDVTVDPGDAALVDAIIAMAHSLNLEVVAEGVETAAQLAYLARRRCDQIQGYFFSRPLPAAQFAHLLMEGATLALPDGAGAAPERTLLIIDDEPQVLSSLQRLLRQDGYRVLTASGAGEAFSLLAQHPVQLILCDQRMEEMSGTELLDRIKDMYPDTFRIILSGYTDLATIMESINRGALHRFYSKPWDSRMLRENVAAGFRHYWQLNGLSQADAAQCA